MKTKSVVFYRENRFHGTADFPCGYYRADGSERNFLVKHHWHEEIEIIYLKQGNFHIEVNMDKYEVGEECFCFINSEELHCIHSQGDYVENAVVFSPAMLCFADHDQAQSRLIGPLRERKLSLPRFLKVGEAGFKEIKDGYLSIMKIFENREPKGELAGAASRNPGRQLQVKAALLQILAVMAEWGLLQGEMPVTDRRVEMIKKAITYMQEHYSDKIYVGDVADQINMNEQYFCRFFKKMIGKPPMAYLGEVRIWQASRLLAETDKPVTEICLESGFNNLGNFMKAFRKSYGCTPLQYRKERS